MTESVWIISRPHGIVELPMPDPTSERHCARGIIHRKSNLRQHTGGGLFKLSGRIDAGPTAALNSPVCSSNHELPTARCERCGARFDHLHPHPRMSPKRFCSERCRKAAEHARANRRKRNA
jgi:hypothetical protein